MQPIGLYIHIPFCDGKCYYCDFFSEKHDSAAMDEYAANLMRIIGLWGNKLNRSVSTVYFGGGTPSLLGHKRLISILDAVRGVFEVDSKAEITVEVNPSSANYLDFGALRRSGFNRLSVGMQSADDNELRLLGRRHNAGDVSRTVETAQAGGFDNISLDVMLAIPGQTKESLSRSLEYIADLGAKHISAYILKIEEGTRFYRERDKLELFSDDEQADLYQLAVGKLAELGYEQYEISNFSKPGYESRHNLIYWHDDEYLGIGPSAHSFIDGNRFFYNRSFDGFYSNNTVFEGVGGGEDEYIMLVLRLREGLSFDIYRERYHEDINESFLNAAMVLEKEGLVRITPSSLSLTPRGFLVSNAVIAYLLTSI